MCMAASRAVAAIGLGGSGSAGLRPVPQGVRTQAAGAAYQGIGAGTGNRDGRGKSVFRRHSTQSPIATRLRRELRKFSRLLVDRPVYSDAAPVYKSCPIEVQVYELRVARAVYGRYHQRGRARPAVPR